MSTNEVRRQDAAAAKIDLKLEVVVIPVSDVDRAKQFYAGLGWRLDADVAAGNVRLVQFTPPGSACSIQFGRNLFGAKVAAGAPGSVQGLYLIVSDIAAARNDLMARGVDASEIFHCATGFACRFPGNEGRASGPQPERQTYGSFVSFQDPDGNGWLLQEITARLPGRIDAAVTAFASVNDLAEAMRRAEAAHGEHEKRTGQRDANWPDWYARYMAAEQAGTELPR